MKLLGEAIFARDAEGRLLSRIGTMFFKTPGLVTQKGVHAMQRVMWLEAINAARAAAGEKTLSPAEEEAEIAESVDLVFSDDLVMIRPNPERMDLAFRADEELQKLVSKRQIRFLNTSSALVRKALRERGENWRMARQPISQDDMAELVTASKVAIENLPIYYYNHATGTRFLTAGAYVVVSALPDDAFRRQVAEIVTGLNKRNRLGRPEVDLFPLSTPIEVKRAFRDLKADALDIATLRAACAALERDWRMSLPAELREETVGNFDWRNAMCHELTRGPNETVAEEQELIAGIAPEFYRQIEWLPGARLDGGEVIFDAVYDEAARTGQAELKAICDSRVKSFLFNTTRLLGDLAYVNVGRIAHSLSRHPVEGSRRGNVYIVQYRERGAVEAKVQMIRLQKWGVAEHLDEGKDLLQAITETNDYSDYILDRRLMCLQLGMNLPTHIGYGHFTETYHGRNEYDGRPVRTDYFVREYVPGIASDKVPVPRFRNPAFALRFAELMGEAAAVDMVVGRRITENGAYAFDGNYEVIRLGADGLPAEVKVTDHAGSFVYYDRAYGDFAADYAAVVLRRKAFVADFAGFAAAFLTGFTRRLAEVQSSYRARRAAFDGLFADRPYDANGSGAYRWACALKRLDACDPKAVAARLKAAIGC